MATVAVDRRRRFRLDTETAAPFPPPLLVRASGMSCDEHPECPGAGVPLASLPTLDTPWDIVSVGVLTHGSSESGMTAPISGHWTRRQWELRHLTRWLASPTVKVASRSVPRRRHGAGLRIERGTLSALADLGQSVREWAHESVAGVERSRRCLWEPPRSTAN